MSIGNKTGGGSSRGGGAAARVSIWFPGGGQRRCPRPILSGASWSAGAGYGILCTLFTAGRWARLLPGLGRPAVKFGEPAGDWWPV